MICFFFFANRFSCCWSQFHCQIYYIFPNALKSFAKIVFCKKQSESCPFFAAKKNSSFVKFLLEATNFKWYVASLWLRNEKVNRDRHLSSSLWVAVWKANRWTDWLFAFIVLNEKEYVTVALPWVCSKIKSYQDDFAFNGERLGHLSCVELCIQRRICSKFDQLSFDPQMKFRQTLYLYAFQLPVRILLRCWRRKMVTPPHIYNLFLGMQRYVWRM